VKLQGVLFQIINFNTVKPTVYWHVYILSLKYFILDQNYLFIFTRQPSLLAGFYSVQYNLFLPVVWKNIAYCIIEHTTEE